MTLRSLCLEAWLAPALALLLTVPPAAADDVAAQGEAREDGAGSDAAAERAPEGEGQRTEIASQDILPVYVRPRGAAGGREGGGTRGIDTLEVVALLPPDHTAFTTRAQPTLYWHLSEPTDGNVVITVSRGDAEQPLLEQPLPGPLRAGIHPIELSELGVRLDPDVLYRWYVQVVPVPGAPGRSRFSGGSIQRVVPGDALRTQLDEAPAGWDAAVYAQHGIWCDALDSALRHAAANPGDAQARRAVPSLLEQVDLSGIADTSPPNLGR